MYAILPQIVILYCTVKYLNEIKVSVHLVLEEDVWTTGHNISIRGDRDATKDFHTMVVTYRQSLEFPPSSITSQP